jgi:flagellar biosynthesis/type III secretory pathway protein FliH
MTFITLFDSSHGFLASDQCVFDATELSRLRSVIEQSEQLSVRLVDQELLLDGARDAARTEGHAEGYARGEADAKAQMATELANLHTRYQHEVDILHNSCAQLAVEIVRKIAGQIAPEEWLCAQALQAAEEMIDQPVVTLHVHADQVDAVRTHCEKLTSTHIAKVTGDEGVASQYCVLETTSGRVEVDMDTQLDNILQLLDNSRSSHV